VASIGRNSLQVEGIDYEVSKQYIWKKNRLLKLSLHDNSQLKGLCQLLSIKFTEYLIENNLFKHALTIHSMPSTGSIKKRGYFIWTGTESFKLPKQLVLPTVIKPRAWEIDRSGQVHYGGYYLTEFLAEIHLIWVYISAR
jgi:hypothetical protein